MKDSKVQALVALLAAASLAVVFSIPGIIRLFLGLTEPAPLDREGMHKSLAVARAAVAREAGWVVNPGDESASPAALGQKATGPVFVSLYAAGRPPDSAPAVGRWLPHGQTETALGDALVAAATQAAVELKQAGLAQKPEGLRVKVDLAGPARSAWMAGLISVDLLVDPGRDGLVGTRGDQTVYVLPSWLVERNWRPSAAVGWMRKRLGGEDGGMAVARFRTFAFVDGTEDEPGPLPIFRGNVLLPPLTAQHVRQSIEWAGEYLARMAGPDGRYCYNYLVVRDQCDSDYNLLRHAGTTYSLFQIHRLIPRADFLEAAERATRWLRQQTREVEGDPSRVFLLEGEKAKLGAVGLGLLALVEREKDLRDGQDRELMARMANFILSQQRHDGFMVSFFGWRSGVDVPRENSIYYPGEALLGLLRLHDIDPQPRYLEAAILTAEFLVMKRWRWGGIELYVPPDAWLSQALAELHGKKPDIRWARYGTQIARTFEDIMLQAEEGAQPDMVGGPAGGGFLPSSATAGARNEGLTSLRELALRSNNPEEEKRLRALVMASAAFQLHQQYRPANSYFLSNPQRARGGIRGRPDFQEVRIDYVQHNVSGLLPVLQLLEGRP